MEEGFKSDFIIDKIFVKESSLEKFKEKFSSYMNTYDKKLFIINDNLFKVISCTENSQGVLAVLNMKEEILSLKDGLYILADKVQDPGNLGTIIRTAHSAGCRGVILSKDTVDLYDEDLSFTKKLISEGYNLVCSSLETDKNFYEVNLVDNGIIAVGNEGNGISDEVVNLATYKVKIPMLGNTESLNVAIAASIMIYEGVRQKLINKKD